MRITSPTWIVLWATLVAAVLVQGMPKMALGQYGNYSNYNDLPADSTSIFLDSAKVFLPSTPSIALPLASRALELAIVNRNANGEARAYLLMAEAQQRLGRNSEAIESLFKCKSLFVEFASGIQSVNNSSRVQSNANTTYRNPQVQARGKGLDNRILLEATIALASALEEGNRWAEAYAETETWLLLLSTAKAKNSPNTAWRTQARLNSKMGNGLEATRRLQQLSVMEENANDLIGLTLTLIEWGEHFQRIGDHKRAKPMLQRALDMAETHQMKEQNMRAASDMATVYKAEGNLKDEVNSRNAVVQLQRGTAVQAADYFQTIDIGNAYLKANELDRAAQYMDSSVEQITSQINDPAYSAKTDTMATVQVTSFALQAGADAYRKIAEGYLKKSELEKALAYFKKYAILQDSVRVVNAREIEAALTLSKSLGKNEERVQLLERERDLSDVSIQLLRQDQASKSSQIFTRNLIIGVLISCLALMVVVGLILTKNTRARRRADKLLALQSMTGRMNPHFIFNALNSVNAFISQNDERAANRYLTAFSKLMRKVMDDSRQTFIPLTEEIDMLKLYLELEHARFKDQFEYEFLVDEALANAEFRLPPMLVQPYIENAIWHGLRYRKDGGHLSVHFHLLNDALAITIADDGIGILQSKSIKTAQQKLQNSMGMRNISTRMALMNEIYGSAMTVKLTETHPGAAHPGTTVQIVIKA